MGPASVIRGHFVGSGARQRAFVAPTFVFPALAHRRLPARLLVDTGADSTILSSMDAVHLGDAFRTLPLGPIVCGVGGAIRSRLTTAFVVLGTYAIPLELIVPEAQAQPTAMPSILGRDILAHFALFLEQRTGRVLLLDREDAAEIRLPQ